MYNIKLSQPSSNGVMSDGSICLDSVNQDHAKETTSKKYSFIPTNRILNTLKETGWIPVKAQESKVRKEDKQDFQKHLIRLQNINHRISSGELQLTSSGLIPEIILSSAHDGSASFLLMAGMFRSICANGLIVADSMFGVHKIRHIGYTDEKVKEAIYNVVESTPKIFNRVQEFQNIPLKEEERIAFADSALKLRFDDEQLQELNTNATIQRLLAPRRPEDTNATLWNTFNVIQEKFLKGGRFSISKERKVYANKTREVKSISENIRLNKSLWTLTEKMAELKNT